MKTSLILTHKVPGQSQLSIRPAARIRIDGSGGIQVFNASGMNCGRIDAADVSSVFYPGLALATSMPLLASAATH